MRQRWPFGFRWLPPMGPGTLLVLFAALIAARPPTAAPQPPLPELRWIEEPYDEAQEHPPGAPYQRCLGGSRFSPQVACSPSGAWEAHPSYDETASLCLVRRGPRGEHGRWYFSRRSQLPDDEGLIFRQLLSLETSPEGRDRLRCLISPRPVRYFWAGDESGVFVLYHTGEFYFVGAPETEATRLDWDLRGRLLLGSPHGTQDVIVLEALVETGDYRTTRYRLVVLDRTGQELECLDEFDSPQSRPPLAEATSTAIMMALDPGPPREAQLRPAYRAVHVYRRDERGLWEKTCHAGLALPALRGGDLTLTSAIEYRGQAWIQQIDASGAAQLLFPLPEKVSAAGGESRCSWNGRGDCLVFADCGALVRLQGELEDQPLPGPSAAPSGWVFRPYDETYSRLHGTYLRCLGWSPFPRLARWSPDGEWVIHPTMDGRESICLVSPSLGLHTVICSMSDELPGFAGVHADWPGTFFWAGDGSGIYLFYTYSNDAVEQYGFFVTVPDGTISRLKWYTGGQPLGSPAGTRDLLLLKTDWLADDVPPQRYRLCLVGLDGRERLCLDELDPKQVGLLGRAEATPWAAMLAFDPNYTPTAPRRYSYRQVMVYRPAGGQWSVTTYRDVAAPALRQDCLTRLVFQEGQPWLEQVAPSGEEEQLCALPQACTTADAIFWSGPGHYAIIGSSAPVVVHQLTP